MPDQNPHTSLTPEEAAAGIRKYRNAEDQELARLKEAMNRTGDEKFAYMMNLMQVQRLLEQSVKLQKQQK